MDDDLVVLLDDKAGPGETPAEAAIRRLRADLGTVVMSGDLVLPDFAPSRAGGGRLESEPRCEFGERDLTRSCRGRSLVTA